MHRLIYAWAAAFQVLSIVDDWVAVVKPAGMPVHAVGQRFVSHATCVFLQDPVHPDDKISPWQSALLTLCTMNLKKGIVLLLEVFCWAQIGDPSPDLDLCSPANA